MKLEIQKYIRMPKLSAEKASLRKKTRKAMAVMDTLNTAFDKISLDIVGQLRQPKADSYTLTIQDYYQIFQWRCCSSKQCHQR